MDEAEKQTANQEAPTFRQISELFVEWLQNLDGIIYTGLFCLAMVAMIVLGGSGFVDSQGNTTLLYGILARWVALGLVLIYSSRNTMHLRDKTQHVPIIVLVVVSCFWQCFTGLMWMHWPL
jgi:hypothetical protein